MIKDEKKGFAGVELILAIGNGEEREWKMS
jgi:hypothetical protein